MSNIQWQNRRCNRMVKQGIPCLLAMADWQGLHSSDLLPLILNKVKLIQDFVAFGPVCKSWHQAFAGNKRSLSQPQTPWLMLPEKKGEDYHRRIFSLSKQNILTKSLYVPELSDKRCISLNYGWVLTISPRKEGEMSLGHPLSRSRIELPPQTSIVEYDEYETGTTCMFTRRAALAADPSKSPSDFVLMILHSAGRYLGYWRPDDREWTRVERLNYSSDLTYYQDQFYTVNYGGEVWSHKVSSHKPVVPRQIIQIPSKLVNTNWPYIVGNAGTLLVLARDEDEADDPFWDPNINNGDRDYWVADFQVYELGLIKGTYKQIKNIGDRAIFVGDNTSICLDHASQFPGVKSNHIYYTDDRHESHPFTKEGGGKDMGSYHIQNGQTTPFEIEESSSRINPPFWFIPSL